MNRKIAYVLLGVVVFGGLFLIGRRDDRSSDGASQEHHEHISTPHAKPPNHNRQGVVGSSGEVSRSTSTAHHTTPTTTGADKTNTLQPQKMQVPDAIKQVSAANMAKGQKVVDSIAINAVKTSSQKASSAPTMKCLMAFISRGAENAFKGKLQIKLKVKQDPANKDQLIQEVDQIVAQPSDQKQPNQTLKALDEEAYLCFYKALDAKFFEKPPKADEFFEKHERMDVESAFDVQVRGKK